jgi:hypothetical protein
MAKQFGFEQLFRQRAAVIATNGIMTRAGVVDRLTISFPVPLC